MSAELDRRNFLSISIAATSSGVALGGTSLLDILSGPNAIATVHEILKQYLDVKDSDLDVVARFVASLKQASTHTESAEHFQSLLRDASGDDELSTYVVQEFVVSTNYLAMQSGEAQVLANLV